MNSYKLKIEPIQIQQITEFQVTKQVNEHIFLTAAGIIRKEEAEEILRKQKSDEEILVTLMENGADDVILFNGYILNLHLRVEGMVYKIRLSAASFTYLLDQTKRFRTFQNGNQTYKELVKEVLSLYQNAAVICTAGDERIGSIQVQYQETDWEFLKRMASQLHTVLVAEGHLNKAAFYFGMRKGKREWEIPGEACSVRDFVSEEGRYREYEFEAELTSEIGDKVIYQNRRTQVYEAVIRLANHELDCVIHSRGADKCRKETYENQSLAGTSLKGEVTAVRNEKVRIFLVGDIGRETKKRWFDYATVYSSPDGSGWYFMPEVGDEVCLYFPDETAEHAYVLNAVHMEGSDKRKNPECKYIRTKGNQEIRFTPGQIKITNHRGSSVVLDDEKGIELKSNKSIVLEAGEAINISSGGVVAAKGKSAVILKQSINMIAVRDGIREQGVRIERQ